MGTEKDDDMPGTGGDEVAPAGKPTLMHRIRRRMRRRRVDVALQDVAVIEASGRFDKQWYLQRNPDIAKAGIDPIQHYVRHGAAEGRDPTEAFSTRFYLQNYPDVAASGMNPFRHYLEHGSNEGRRGRPGTNGASTALSVRDTGTVQPSEAGNPRIRETDAQTIVRSGIFDRAYYLAACSGLVPSDVDPVDHYLQFGVTEGRDPCALFGTRYYLKRNPDVAASGMNPLVHFCRYGFKELRDPSPDFSIAWYALVHLDGDLKVNALAHYLAQGVHDKLEIRAVTALSDKDKQELGARSRRLLERVEPRECKDYLTFGRALARLSLWTDAEAAFSRALAIAWGDPSAHASLALILARQGKWWQAVESWGAATNLDTSRASWFFHLGEAQEKMNRFALAAEAYQRALELEPDHPQWYYLLGYMHEKAGEQNLADAAYAQAVARDSRKDAKELGIGVFHQARGYWPEACAAYARELQTKPSSAELHFKFGMAHDRCYRWHEAEAAYRNAIALKADVPYWHYREGFVLERQARFGEAAEAYAAAAAIKSKPMPYWQYRRGCVLVEACRYKEACLAYIKAREAQTIWDEVYNPSDFEQTGKAVATQLADYLDGLPNKELVTGAVARDPADAHSHYQLGAMRERWGDWAGAAKAYADAVARSNSHRPNWYYRLGFTSFLAGLYEEACLAFRQTHALGRAYGVDTRDFSGNQGVYENMLYREYSDTLQIRSNTVLYESTHGASIGGNPYAIFEHLLDHPDYHGWTHLWVVAADVAIPHALRSRTNVVFVEYKSDLYRRYLATASHLINDSTFPYWFSRRPEQRYLNTWHGTPLKTLGKPIRADEEFLSHRNIQRNLLHATHLISPNRHTSDVLMNDFDVRGIYAGKLAETGYPRIDRTLNATPARNAMLRSSLGLSDDRPIAVYAPTWRGVFGHTELDLERLRSDLAELASLPCQWVFRGHPFSEALLRDAGLPIAIASSDIDTADLLAITDILVTDYSSIFFDFLPMRRPIFHYCYDLEEYERSRGMYFDIHEMPGVVCEEIETLATAVGRVLAGSKPDLVAYEAALDRFCPHEDGNATAKAVAFFFHDDGSCIVDRYKDDRPSLLFFGGHFAPNGINTSFVTLISVLESAGQYNLAIAVEPNRITKEPAWLEKFRTTPYGISVIGKTGHMVVSAEQEWVARRFRARRTFASPAMRETFRRAYYDEYRRCFGDANFDVLVDFDGYNPYWTSLFGFGRTSTRNACWLHADFYEEFVLKHPYLASQFAAYPEFDSLVSVSERMSDVNRAKLSTRFRLDPARFHYCVNMVDEKDLASQAKGRLDADFEGWLEQGATFVILGRLSPEKDHAKLISAFARVAAKYPAARLLVLGEGPLRTALQQQIAQLGLEQSVYLAGLRSNPFPLLRRCDCFVLSSNHEGQPMVLLEAMVLGKPIVATDIDGNRGVLKDGYGHLVDNSVAGLERGMLDFLAGKLAFKRFDAATYRKDALGMFDDVIGCGAGTVAD